MNELTKPHDQQVDLVHNLHALQQDSIYYTDNPLLHHQLFEIPPDDIKDRHLECQQSTRMHISHGRCGYKEES